MPEKSARTRQQGAHEDGPGEAQANTERPTGIAQHASHHRANHADGDGEFQPGQVQKVHDTSSIVPRYGLTWFVSRDASRDRKSVQRRSSESHQRNTRTNGAT